MFTTYANKQYYAQLSCWGSRAGHPWTPIWSRAWLPSSA